MTDINFRKYDPDSWVPTHFVAYFYGICDTKYGSTAYERNYPKDCPIMRFVMDDFLNNSRPLHSVVHFIDWCFDRHEQKRFDFPLTVEFLKSLVPRFLQIPYAKQKKVYNHLDEVVLTPEQRKWMREKRKAYKNGESVYTQPIEKPKRKPAKRKRKRKLQKAKISKGTLNATRTLPTTD